MKSSRKVLAVLLAGAMALSATACSKPSGSSSASPTSTATTSGTAGATSSGLSEDKVPTIDQINLGTDFKDIKANLTVLTNRTDIYKTVFAKYITEFQKLYPNVKISYQADTTYDDDTMTKLTSKNWGDICSIPNKMKNTDLTNYFTPFGSVDTLSQKYNFCTAQSYGGQCYGISTCGNVEGIVYNKKVFKDAGITDLPKTPSDFLKDLKEIKTKTKAIPLYTNFHSGWALGQWDSYIGICATGDPDFMNNKWAKMKDPFSKTSFAAGTGPYAVYNTLYEAVKQKLTEADPTTSDWESSKPKINNGQIATMVLGSWAVSQMQGAGPHKDDIGYMPFPTTVNGQQYSSMGSDYCYGINKNDSITTQIAAMCYVKWLTEKSNFAYDQGCVPIVKGADLPSILSDFKKANVKLLEDNPAKTGEEDITTNVKNDAEFSDTKHDQDIVECAFRGTKTMDQLASEWNTKWASAQKSNNVTVG